MQQIVLFPVTLTNGEPDELTVRLNRAALIWYQVVLNEYITQKTNQMA